VTTLLTGATLLIDGDEYLYKACAALETEVQWDEQNHVLACNAEEAWDVFVGSIEKIKDALDAETGYLAFTGKGNFRQAIYPPYKNHRPKRKPMCYGLLRERAQQHFKCHSVDGLEADDVLGIWATSGKFGDTIVVSSDKDMQTLPTRIYRGGEVVTVSVSEANYFWLFQTLTGDTADGYPGCPGIGKVKAEKLLDEFWAHGKDHPVQEYVTEAAWEAVVRTFEAAGLTYDDALTQARLARILRVEDWDSEKKEVKLWNPK
jgi:DNA polymerase-1